MILGRGMDAFCPRCGSLMSEVDDWLTCTREGVGVSPHLRGELERWAASDPVKPAASGLGRGGGWHCPADGELLTFDDECLECGTCHRYLPGRLIYEAVELNWPPPGQRN